MCAHVYLWRPEIGSGITLDSSPTSFLEAGSLYQTEGLQMCLAQLARMLMILCDLISFNCQRHTIESHVTSEDRCIRLAYGCVRGGCLDCEPVQEGTHCGRRHSLGRWSRGCMSG